MRTWFFWVFDFFGHEMFLVISRCRKYRKYVDTETRKCYTISLQLAFVPVWPRCFYMCQKFEWILYQTYPKYIFKFFSDLIFYSIASQNFKTTCHICFFVLYISKNSCFCFVAIKMNVKVLGNYRVPYQQTLEMKMMWHI